MYDRPLSGGFWVEKAGRPVLNQEQLNQESVLTYSNFAN